MPPGPRRAAWGLVLHVTGSSAAVAMGAAVRRTVVDIDARSQDGAAAAAHAVDEAGPGAKQGVHGQRAATQIGQRNALLGLGLRLGPAQAVGEDLVDVVGVADRGIQLAAKPTVAGAI